MKTIRDAFNLLDSLPSKAIRDNYYFVISEDVLEDMLQDHEGPERIKMWMTLFGIRIKMAKGASDVLHLEHKKVKHTRHQD